MQQNFPIEYLPLTKTIFRWASACFKIKTLNETNTLTFPKSFYQHVDAFVQNGMSFGYIILPSRFQKIALYTFPILQLVSFKDRRSFCSTLCWNWAFRSEFYVARDLLRSDAFHPVPQASECPENWMILTQVESLKLVIIIQTDPKCNDTV